MEVREFSEYKSSVEQAAETANEEVNGHPTVARDRTIQTECPECGGQVIATDDEAVCSDCAAVVAAEFIDRGPTLADLGMVGFEPSSNIETVTQFRTDKGLHTMITTGKDGYGNPLSDDKHEKFERLKKWHMRFQFQGSRKQSKRHNEALRDVEMLIGNLALPEYVGKDAARWIQQANDANLPGGHMAWESLAGGAVLLAAIRAGLPRSPTEVAQHAKTSTERLCAAARKLRVELGLDIPPVREDAVRTVIDALDEHLAPDADDETLTMVRSRRLAELSQHLLELADDGSIGAGTPRLTVAAAAVYAGLKLLGETTIAWKYCTQAEMAAAVSPLIELSKGKVGRYNCEVIDAYEARHGNTDPAAVLKRDDDQAD